MALYIHIPFCHRACHYCDFHFSTNLRRKNEMIAALLKEIALQKDFFADKKSLGSIYFGGGTPSMLEISELEAILSQVRMYFAVEKNAEITLEANPEDFSKEKLAAWKSLGINRLSIGIQSFQDKNLQFLNRAHTRKQALDCVDGAKNAGFENITIDLIYGIPNMTQETWLEDLLLVKNFDIPHVSAYSLTVEAGTALGNWVKKGKILMPEDDFSAEHFDILVEKLNEYGLNQYEISNFGKQGFYSRHNTNYWKKGHYLGIGPSAHSYNGEKRFANIANNHQYVKDVSQNILPHTIENLGKKDHINEYILTMIRTEFGIDTLWLKENLQFDFLKVFDLAIQKQLQHQNIRIENNIIFLTHKGKFLADAITCDFFL